MNPFVCSIIDLLIVDTPGLHSDGNRFQECYKITGIYTSTDAPESWNRAPMRYRPLLSFYIKHSRCWLDLFFLLYFINLFHITFLVG